MKYYSLGLVGYPLSHSLSPGIHLTALHALGLAGEYQKFEIRPDGECGLALSDLMMQMRDGSITGLNVTIPYKHRILNYLDELTPTAAATGAVNTILCRDGLMVGENTDVGGFLEDLGRRIPIDSLEPKSALILGAGGASRAVAFALLSSGWQLILANRTLENAEAMAQELHSRQAFQGPIEVLPLPFQPERLNKHRISLVVNTTSAGLKPQEKLNPWPENTAWPEGSVVYDLIYNPPETEFLRSARAAGLQAISGLGMLVEQAVLSFELWTGQSPPRLPLYQQVLTELVGNEER